jgi:DNA-binding transcriptional LysR family regulator
MPWDDRIARRLKLRDLYVLKAVAELGSMGKAAAQLAVTQPAISKAITDLEHVLGVRLLDRSRQGVEPTAYGTVLLKWSATVFDNLRQGVDEIDFLADPSAGELRIGTSEAMLQAPLPAVIDRLSRRYPRMIFSVLMSANITAQYSDLRARKVDLVFGRLATSAIDEDLNVEILCEDQLRVVAGMNSKWRRRRKIQAAELINELWALPPYDLLAGSIVKEAFRAKGLDPPRQAAMSNTLQLISAMVATGRFLGVLSLSTLRLGGKSAAVKVLPVDLPMQRLTIAIVTLKGRSISPAAHLFIECAREIVKPLMKAV